MIIVLCNCVHWFQQYTSWTMWNMGLLCIYCVFQAVCCSDGKHCCPENTKCEVSSGKCLRGDSVRTDWFEKRPALRAQNVVCPDGQPQCRTGQTCCKLSSGQYGCCPLPKVSVLEMLIYFKELKVPVLYMFVIKQMNFKTPLCSSLNKIYMSSHVG